MGLLLKKLSQSIKKIGKKIIINTTKINMFIIKKSLKVK